VARLKGVVKWFSAENGFGFIEAESNKTGDFFVDYSSIQVDGFKTLERGQKVEFEFEKSERGNVARKVIIIK